MPCPALLIWRFLPSVSGMGICSAILSNTRVCFFSSRLASIKVSHQPSSVWFAGAKKAIGINKSWKIYWSQFHWARPCVLEALSSTWFVDCHLANWIEKRFPADFTMIDYRILPSVESKGDRDAIITQHLDWGPHWTTEWKIRRAALFHHLYCMIGIICLPSILRRPDPHLGSTGVVYFPRFNKPGQSEADPICQSFCTVTLWLRRLMIDFLLLVGLCQNRAVLWWCFLMSVNCFWYPSL